jgi:transposase-like protein
LGVLVTDDEIGLQNAVSFALPEVELYEDLVHFKRNVVLAAPKQQEGHAAYDTFIEPLLRSISDDEFQALLDQSFMSMPAWLRAYLSKRRNNPLTPLQRLRSACAERAP